MSDNEYYIGSSSLPLKTDEDNARLIQRLRQYLELRNLSVLMGNGCSLPLGSPRIDDVTKLDSELAAAPYCLTNADCQSRALRLLKELIPPKGVLGVEPLLTVLANIQSNEQLLRQATSVNDVVVPAADARCLEDLLKKWLYLKCRAVSTVADEDLQFHEELLRRILLRSTNLPRAKIFTLNYDLVIERALDNLGVLYFDGFLGTISRTLRTESYHYDLYYPGETTEGRVTRVDRVLHLYKLHGSINWRRRSAGASDVAINHGNPDDSEYGDVMIYPSPLKVTEMNGYPYSEMFRHFSAQIHQPQSVLIAIGYRFQDSHINRLIYQALSIPSFVLIIVVPQLVVPKGGEALEDQHAIWRLIQLGSKRIVVIVGGQKDADGKYTSGAGTLQGFSTNWMPDISELNVEANAREEVAKLFGPPKVTGLSDGD
jgi:hypothetical protein